MKVVNMHDAKTNLSRLVDEEFIIARNGVPVARVTPILTSSTKLFGSMPNIRVPDDFDTMLSGVIAELFYGPETVSDGEGGR